MKSENCLLLQEQPAFLLVTDLASISQEAIIGREVGHIQKVMQACIMYNLSVRLPIAFMAELRVQQVCARNPARCCTMQLFMYIDAHMQLSLIVQ